MNLNMPRFTAEASLSRVSGHYRSSRNALNAGAQITSGIDTALRNEDINIHSCAPGWTEVAGRCWLNPLTEPVLGGGGDEGPSPVQEPGGGGGRGGGTGSRGEPIVSAGCTLRQIKSRLGRWCIGQTERDVASGHGVNDIHHLVCNGDQMECCTITSQNKRGHCYQLGGR